MKTQFNAKKALLVPAFVFATGFAGAVFAQDNSALVAQVQSALSQDAILKGAQVKVMSKSGRIVLFGDASSEQAAAAYRDAAGLSGGTAVLNFIVANDIGG
jgi:glutamate synthase domain-containing protein 3